MILSPERTSFDRVTDLVWMGSRIATLDDFRRLRSEGIRACVDMKQEGADPWGFDVFLWLPTPDHEAPSVGVSLRRTQREDRAPQAHGRQRR